MWQTASVLVLCGMCCSAPAQQHSPDKNAPKIVQDYRAATSDADRELVLRRYSPVDRLTLHGICDVGEDLQKAGDFPGARAHFEVCAALALRVDDELYRSIGPQLLGGLDRLEGKYEDSETHYLQALEAAQLPAAAARFPFVLNNLASVYSAQSRYGESLEMLRQTIAYNERQGIRDDAAPWQNTGSVYGLMGDMARALPYFLKAQAIYEERKDQGKLAMVHYNIGVLHSLQSNYAGASSEFDIALGLATRVGDQIELAMIYGDLGRMRGIEGKPVEARVALDRALGLSREIGFRAAIVDALLNNANFEADAGEGGKATAHFDEALQLARQLNDVNGQGSAIRGLGLLARRQKDYAAALRYAEQGLKLAIPIGDRLSQWQSEALAGMALRGMGEPDKARAAYTRAIGLIEQQRGLVAGGEVEKQRFFEQAVYPYQELAMLEAESGNPVTALQAAERTRARVLLDIIEAGPNPIDRLMSDDEKAQEKTLRTRLAAANARLARSRAGAQQERDDLWHKYESFLAALYARQPALRTWRGDSPVIQETELAALVPDGKTAALEFLSGQDQTLLFSITRVAGKLRVKTTRIPVGRKELTRRAGAFRAQLEGRDPAFRAAARSLYQLLLQPVAAELRGRSRIILVADGPLWEMPFQALLTPAGRYLIEDAAISTAPSLSFLRDQSTLAAKRAFTSELVAFGDPTRPDLAAIPELAAQARRIGALYAPGRVLVRTGAEARESVFKRDAPGARVLHVAAHGVMDRQNPLHSRILLAPEPGREDGWLEAWELMRMNLNADLVVLSACESGRGRAAEGEGLVGLTWTLFVAGVKTAIVSQWRVDSAGTTELMTGLHQRLRRGEKPAEALRGAILSLMKDERYRHPMYWSAFVAAGL